jgi:hypothetical protein
MRPFPRERSGRSDWGHERNRERRTGRANSLGRCWRFRSPVGSRPGDRCGHGGERVPSQRASRRIIPRVTLQLTYLALSPSLSIPRQDETEAIARIVELRKARRDAGGDSRPT